MSSNIASDDSLAVSNEDITLIRKSIESDKIEALPTLNNSTNIIDNLLKNVDNQKHNDMRTRLVNQMLEQYKQNMFITNPTLINNVASIFQPNQLDKSFAFEFRETYLNKLTEFFKIYSNNVDNLKVNLEQDLFINGSFGLLSNELSLDRKMFRQLFNELIELIDLDNSTH